MDQAKNAGLLMASGLITGEALIGILIAVLTAVQWNFSISDDPLGGSLIGLLILTIILIYFYQMVSKIAKKKAFKNSPVKDHHSIEVNRVQIFWHCNVRYYS